jgi:hypothetical protein
MAKGKIYTEEELHKPPKKHKKINNCLTSIANWFLKILQLKKKKQKANVVQLK